MIINKQEIIGEFASKTGDVGSSKVQIAILTKKIEILTKHVQKFKKDNSSRRGLLLMIERRRKLLSYIKKKNSTVYLEILTKLGLRK
mgnify:CR=1 FL=1